MAGAAKTRNRPDRTKIIERRQAITIAASLSPLFFNDVTL
jgi:hypothetical protein